MIPESIRIDQVLNAYSNHNILKLFYLIPNNSFIKSITLDMHIIGNISTHALLFSLFVTRIFCSIYLQEENNAIRLLGMVANQRTRIGETIFELRAMAWRRNEFSLSCVSRNRHYIDYFCIIRLSATNDATAMLTTCHSKSDKRQRGTITNNCFVPNGK
jgi:hypothetical protein